MTVVNEILKALRDPGRDPEHHIKVMNRHRDEWPTLWKALDRLMLGDTPPATWGCDCGSNVVLISGRWNHIKTDGTLDWPCDFPHTVRKR